MEPVHKRRITFKFEPEDFISNMPDIVITNILDRLRIQDAVRTSTLSTNWRFKWTTLSQLVFDGDFFKYLSQTQGKNDPARIVSRILLDLRGGITKFVLCINDHVLDVEDISHWILFLSRKGIKDLTLKNRAEMALNLPTHLFSCLELEHLEIYNYCFHPPRNFRGFPNLLSLNVCLFDESSELAEGFFTGCPLLEILELFAYTDAIGHVILVEIAKLENLKMLSLCLGDLDSEITSFSAIFELLGSLPKLQELHLDLLCCELTEGGATKRFPTVFPCLKAIKFTSIGLDNGNMLSFFLEMISSSPNLQTLEITACETPGISWTPRVCFPEIDYNVMRLLQLRSVVFTYINASENEVCLVKYLLACSPILKKMVIRSQSSLSSDAKFMFARKLLKLYRASPLVDIDLH